MEPANSSGLQTADAVVYAKPCILGGFILIADGTNAATVVLYDNASAASGTVLAKASIAAGGTMADVNLSIGGVIANNGIYADVAGTGAAYIVHFTAGT